MKKKIYVERLVSVWVEHTYEVDTINDEIISDAVNYNFDPSEEEILYDTMIDKGPVEVYSEDKTLLYKNEQIY